MSTNAAVIVYQDNKPAWAVEIHFDGYPTDLGVWLCDFFSSFKLSEGFTLNAKQEINGVENIVPRMAVEYWRANCDDKHDMFGFYMVPIDQLKGASFDWAYHVRTLNEKVEICVGEGGVLSEDVVCVYTPCDKTHDEHEEAMRLAEHGEP